MPLGARRQLALFLSFLSLATVCSGAIAATAAPSASDQHAEIARGAAAIAAITAKNLPYATAYRLMRAKLEENVQTHRDSDGFIVGSHLAIAVWVAGLPTDVDWRGKALARHSDVTGWVLPRLGMPTADVENTVAREAKLTPAQRQRLADILEDLTARKEKSVD